MKDYDEGKREAAFRREQLEKKRLRALELAADTDRTRRSVAQCLQVNETTVGKWWKEAGVRPGDGRREGIR